MKKNLSILTFILLNLSFAYAEIEERINNVYPNESVDFESPRFLGHPFLSKNVDENGWRISLSETGKRICQFLKYSDVLAVTFQDLEYGIRGWEIKNNKLILSEQSDAVYTPNGFFIDHYTSKIVKSLRCLK